MDGVSTRPADYRQFNGPRSKIETASHIFDDLKNDSEEFDKES
jgi:hypothetical protein